MSGAYAHLTVINNLVVRPVLKTIDGIENKTINLLLRNSEFCELGALGPDYPYLVLRQSKVNKWSDLMHFEKTSDFIKTAIEILIEGKSKGKEKNIAWLLGFCAHVGTDLTIHPIVEKKVGEYEKHQREHRVCEMNQDVYAYHSLNLGGIGTSEHLDSIVKLFDNGGELETTLVEFWRAILEANYPSYYKTEFPDINLWHKWFYNSVDKIAESGKFVPLSRHITPWCGLTYPEFDCRIDDYISNLESPEGKIHYDELFQKALDNVKVIWAKVIMAIQEKDSKIWDFENFDLGTGLYLENPDKFVFWSKK